MPTSRADIAAGKGSGVTRSREIVIEPANDAAEVSLVSCGSCAFYACNLLLWVLVLVAFALSIWAVVRVNQHAA